ncbi:S-adenosylmethionine:tRNA ribosyltransferase-isomerase [Thiovulum sp. ES]|nr:S-adenosylmethionine:tRNA ribosyltransferase-isomerase [Thiovulum sp. ES]
MNKDFLLSSYDYPFDDSLIAKTPVYPRENARLLIYFKESGEIKHTTFSDLIEHIPKDYSVILNNTKVVRARVFGKKESGGKVEILLNRHMKKNLYSVFIRGKVRVGSEIFVDSLTAKVEELISDGSRIVSFWQNSDEVEFSKLLEVFERVGEMPLPPYINRKATEKDEKDYQPIFAKNLGAVASPTASLHFSENMLKELKGRNRVEYLTLHVGAGTFKPVEVSDIREHKLHKEVFEISESAKEVLNSKSKILAVGTTVTRTIEYFAKTGETFGDADIFLHPNNRPQRVDALLTNFHLPKSTLLMLVSSFIGIDEMQKIYAEAVKEKYRFYSYGDGMLII